MPLQTSKSKAAFSHNVEVEMNSGKSQRQSVAIAYAKRRQAGGKDADPEIELGEAIEAGKKELAAQRRAKAALSGDVDIDCSDAVSEAERERLPAKREGLPSEGKYPMPDKEHAANAKARATQELKAGKLTAAEHAEIVRKANKILGEDSARPRLAMDRAPTLRSKDINGWLTIKDCRISKANVCPYLGREIPKSETLGLEPDRVYRMYREAAALEAAAPTFERVPLMIVHISVTADVPNKEKIIGAVSNVRWQAPYLVADLTVWDGEGIEAIESERQQELSPGYHYEPIMTSGVIDGEPYDGIMGQPIIANHVCIVDTGRTGPDVYVNDRAAA